MNRSTASDTKKLNRAKIQMIRRSGSFPSVDTTKGQTNSHQHIAVTDKPKTPDIALFKLCALPLSIVPFQPEVDIEFENFQLHKQMGLLIFPLTPQRNDAKDQEHCFDSNERPVSVRLYRRDNHQEARKAALRERLAATLAEFGVKL